MLRYLLFLALPLFADPFNPENYTVYTLNGVGAFYIDDPTDCLKGRIVNGTIDEPEVLETLLNLTEPNMTILDIGAHIGTYSIPLAKKLGHTGELIAFEPQLKLCSELAQNLTLNRCTKVRIFPLALGSFNGETHLGKPIKHNEGGAYVGEGGEAIELRTLDSFCFEKIDLVKIDVEGSEYDLLLGAERTLREHHPLIVMEIGGNRHKQTYDRVGKHTNFKRVIEKMHQLGYTYTHIAWKNYLFTPKE